MQASCRQMGKRRNCHSVTVAPKIGLAQVPGDVADSNLGETRLLGGLLTRKPAFLFLSSCRCWQGRPRALCRRQPNIATGTKRVERLKPVQNGCGWRGVHGDVWISPAPPQRVHRVSKRGGRHLEIFQTPPALLRDKFHCADDLRPPEGGFLVQWTEACSKPR